MTARSAAFTARRAYVTFSGSVPIALVCLSITLLFIFLILPLVTIFSYAFEKGLKVYLTALVDAHALHAIKLSLITACVAVLVNTIFGISAAWLLSRFRFRGRILLLTLIEVPLAVSPIIAGMIFIMLLGPSSFIGKFLSAYDVQIIFALPGIILATIFVTLPYIARELVPLMEQEGRDDEEAALTLGASGVKMFWHVTLPNIRFALLYGIVLCSSRALGEFGAVSVVSGHIRGKTNTLPLHIEVLYNEYNYSASFACASVMVLMAFVTLAVRELLEDRRAQR